MANRVLIVSHTYPPSSGVGGRRWAKFSKYLNQNSIIPYILTAKSNSKDSLWSQDIKSIKHIFFYRNWYPSVISNTLLSFFDKIHYKLSVFFLKLLTKGNYYDRAVFDKNRLLIKIDNILKSHAINNLIVSGAPFNLLYYAAIYKQKNPEINFIADIRDPWTWGQNYGITLIDSKRKSIEKAKESLVISVADTVIVPTGIMLNYLVKAYPNLAGKIKVLPHGFDKDSIQPRELPLNLHSSKIKVAFIGEFYNGIGHYFELIADAMKGDNSPFLIDFFSRTDRYKEIFTQRSLTGSKVNYYPLIQSEKLFEKLNQYDFILIIHPKFAKDYISTKFYEIVYSKIPIIYISEIGLTSQFIIDTKSGIFLHHDQISDFFKSNEQVSKFKYKEYVDINKFELNYLTQNILMKCLSFRQ